MKRLALAASIFPLILAQYAKPVLPAPGPPGNYQNLQRPPAYQPPAPPLPAVNSCPQIVCTTPPPCPACPAPPPPTICPPPPPPPACPPIPPATVCPPIPPPTACPPFPPPTICPPVPPPAACPPIPPPMTCSQQQPIQNRLPLVQQDVYPSPRIYEEHRRRKLKFHRARKARAARETIHKVVHLVNKCNDDTLRLLMHQSISPNIVSSKVTIAERAAREIGGIFDVICTNGVFSYYAAAKIFCEVTHEDVSCFAFRHDTIDSNESLLPSSANKQESQLRDSADKDDDLNRPEEKKFKLHAVTEEKSPFEQEEKHFLKTMKILNDKKNRNKATNGTTIAPKLRQSRPTQSPDGVIDIHTQNIREETFQQLLRELNDNTNDGSTEKKF